MAEAKVGGVLFDELPEAVTTASIGLCSERTSGLPRRRGFRTWWRRWKDSDEGLDTMHLMRIAGRFARRVKGGRRAKPCRSSTASPVSAMRI